MKVALPFQRWNFRPVPEHHKVPKLWLNYRTCTHASNWLILIMQWHGQKKKTRLEVRKSRSMQVKSHYNSKSPLVVTINKTLSNCPFSMVCWVNPYYSHRHRNAAYTKWPTSVWIYCTLQHWVNCAQWMDSGIFNDLRTLHTRAPKVTDFWSTCKTSGFVEAPVIPWPTTTL